MTNLWRNIQFGMRLLRKNPGFASVAILALALGIGANTAIFSVLYGALLAHLPYRNPERLVSVWSRDQGDRRYVSPADYLDWKRESTVFEGLGAMDFDQVTVAASSSPPEVARITRCTPSLVDALGIPFVLGRAFLPEEGMPGKDHVTVLGYNFWQDHFGGDSSVLGQKVRVDGEPYTIVGVWKPPATERMRDNDRLTLPLSFKPNQVSDRESHGLLVQGRLKPGVTLAQANAEMCLLRSASTSGWLPSCGASSSFSWAPWRSCY
jgi:putative ABC transport system permease protein